MWYWVDHIKHLPFHSHHGVCNLSSWGFLYNQWHLLYVTSIISETKAVNLSLSQKILNIPTNKIILSEEEYVDLWLWVGNCCLFFAKETLHFIYFFMQCNSLFLTFLLDERGRRPLVIFCFFILCAAKQSSATLPAPQNLWLLCRFPLPVC